MSFLTVKKEEKWYLCNDSKISQIKWNTYAEFISHNAYLVFYDNSDADSMLPEELEVNPYTQIGPPAFPEVPNPDHVETKATLDFQ